MKILILGAGNMGMTYAESFLRTHIVLPEQLMLLCRTPEQAETLSTRCAARFFADPRHCVPAADLAILAVKPQDAPVLFEQIGPLTTPGQLWLSIMAGIRMSTVMEALGVRKVVRAMPNLPAQIGAGMTAFTATEDVTRIELVMVQNLLSTTGKTLYTAREALLDAATAISGSGPAYVYFFMSVLIEVAQQMGFSPAEAELLVGQTFTGAVDLYNKANLSCEQWIEKVASKGGTTEAALRVFEEAHLRERLEAGVVAAWRRAEALGDTPLLQ